MTKFLKNYALLACILSSFAMNAHTKLPTPHIPGINDSDITKPAASISKQVQSQGEVDCTDLDDHLCKQ